MKYNSGKSYNSGDRYNAASHIVIERYDGLKFSDSSSIDFIGVIHGEEGPLYFYENSGVFESNFVVGNVGSRDTSVDWFAPIGMKVDWANTSLQVMPTSESEYIDISTLDGSMVQNTIYKNRAFNFVLFSEDGLSDTEKDDLKQKIVKVLDSTKGSFKRLVIQPSEHYFEVKYSGSASIQQGPSFVKATLPFEVKPYSHPMFPESKTHYGTITNKGMKPCGLRVEISGPIDTPRFSASSLSCVWNSSLLDGEKLVIDGESMTCFKISASGEKTNAIKYLEPEGKDGFVLIQPGESIEVYPYTLAPPPLPSENMLSELSEKIANSNQSSFTFSINESYIW